MLRFPCFVRRDHEIMGTGFDTPSSCYCLVEGRCIVTALHHIQDFLFR